MNQKNILISLIDDAIMDVVTYTFLESEGCPTCGYGSDYCTDVTIYFKNENFITTSVHSSTLDTSFSVSFFVRFFCSNLEKIQQMTKQEFIDFFYSQICQI